MSEFDTIIWSLVIMSLLVATVSFALIRAGSLPHPASLVIALSIVAVVSIVGFLLEGQPELAVIGSTATGALAGGVTAQLGSKDKDKPDDSSTLGG